MKKQFFKALGAALRIYDPNNRLVLYVESKPFKLKEDIRVYADESKTKEVMVIRARQIIDFSAAYDVTDTAVNEKVGTLQRHGLKSMVRDEWTLLNGQETYAGRVIEDQMVLALIRRFLTNLVPQSYDIEAGAAKVADLRQQFNPFLYNMEIDFSADIQRNFDRRLGIAAAILLAIIEGRQG